MKRFATPTFQCRWWWWCLCCWKWHGSFTQLWWITLKLIFSLAEGLHWFSFLLLLCLLLHTWWFIAGLIAWFCSDKLKQTIFIYLWCSTLLSLTDKHQSKKKQNKKQKNHNNKETIGFLSSNVWLFKEANRTLHQF